MERFVRLRSEDATEFERRLLDSAVDDAPSAAARARTLAALGIAAGAAAATGALSSAAQAASLSAHEVGASGAAKTGSVAVSVLLKWLGAGAAAGLVTAGTLAVATAPAPAASSGAPAASGGTVTSVASGSKVSAAVVARRALPDVASPRSPEFSSGLDAPPMATAESAAGVPALPRSERGGTSPSSPIISNDATRALPVDDASHVVEEVHSLDFARAALEGGNARAALERLAAHDARFPRGTLEPEAVVLRVRAWLALGRRADATAVANVFLSAHPHSAQASRLRALVAP